MIGISEIKTLTAKLTNDQALQEQLLKSMSTLYDDIETNKNGGLKELATSEDYLCDASMCDQLSQRCADEIVDVEKARKAYEEKTNCERESLIECTTKNTLNSKIHLQKFLDESGMCGMGMGMGNGYTEDGAIDLTVEELLSLQTTLLDIGDSTEKFDSNFESVVKALNEKFAEDGIKSCASMGEENGIQYVEICREDGSTTKIYDANGNGALDMKDYDFCQAICKANEMIEAMKTEICNINTEADNKIQASNDAAEAMTKDLQNKQAALEDKAAEDRREAEKHKTQGEGMLADAKKDGAKLDATQDELDSVNASIAQTETAIDESKSQTETGEGGDGTTTDETPNPFKKPQQVA